MIENEFDDWRRLDCYSGGETLMDIVIEATAWKGC